VVDMLRKSINSFDLEGDNLSCACDRQWSSLYGGYVMICCNFFGFLLGINF
jgi:hypothetical protein